MKQRYNEMLRKVTMQGGVIVTTREEKSVIALDQA